MAKFIAGNLAGMISGKIGNLVFTHGRYGPVIRTRVKPVTTTSPATDLARNSLTACSKYWQTMNAVKKLAWTTYAANNPITDRLGTSQILSPHAAFNQINCRLLQAGYPIMEAPPVVASPAPLTTCTITYNTGAGTTEIAYTPTPLGSTQHIWAWAAVVNSPGIKYTRNLMKLCVKGGAAGNSPIAYDYDVEHRFGTLIVGQTVSFDINVFDHATGLLSAPYSSSGVIVST